MTDLFDPLLPVHLRGHHFLCILTYRGLGYTPAFVANLGAVVAAIGAGAPVRLTEGADAICAGLTEKCRADVAHDCHARETLALDALAVTAVSNLLHRDLRHAAPLTAAEIATLRAAYQTGSIRAACAGCSWKSLCDDIAAAGFADTRLA